MSKKGIIDIGHLEYLASDGRTVSKHTDNIACENCPDLGLMAGMFLW
jgi:hypothetical protein